jgi:hypothetical protein
MKWSRGPLVSRSHHLKGSRRSPARGDATVTIHHRSPPSHVGQPSLSCTWAHRDSSLTSLSPPRMCSLLLLSFLSPSLYSPSLAAMKPARCHLCGSIAPPSSVEGAATPLSSNQQLTAPGDHFSPPSASFARSHRRPTAPNLLWPGQRLEELRKTLLFLFDHTSTTGDPLSTPLMCFPFHHIAPLPTDCSWEHPTALHPKSGSSSTRLAPRPLHCRPHAAGRRRWGRRPPLFLPWAERAKWARPLSWARPSTSMGSAHCNSGISLLSLELFKLNSKISLNFRNS